MIFIDRSIPRAVASALKQVRNDVYWLEDIFDHDVKDPVWLQQVGQNNWLVLMRDKRVRTRFGERQSILENGVGCFILNQGRDPTRWEYLKLIVSTLDQMEDLYAATPRPFIYAVDREGRMRQVLRP